jgi:hypothetical protein
MGKSPYDITVPSMGSSGEEERSEPTVEAVLQFRFGQQWLRLAGFSSVPAAQGARRALIDMASKSNGPDAAQYMRSHTRVAEITTLTWTAVIPG